MYTKGTGEFPDRFTSSDFQSNAAHKIILFPSFFLFILFSSFSCLHYSFFLVNYFPFLSVTFPHKGYFHFLSFQYPIPHLFMQELLITWQQYLTDSKIFYNLLSLKTVLWAIANQVGGQDLILGTTYVSQSIQLGVATEHCLE